MSCLSPEIELTPVLERKIILVCANLAEDKEFE
jgi:hypothetical protein